MAVQAERRRAWRRQVVTVSLSGAAHLALLLALVLVKPPPMAVEPTPIEVVLVEPRPPPVVEPTPEPEPEPPSPAPPAPAPPTPKPPPPPPPRIVARPKPAPPDVVPLPAAPAAAEGFTEASDAQVAGAATAESGGGAGGGAGGGCNMARRLQSALRKDRMVQAAMADAHRGRAIMVWNGDWVRHPSQEGGGLAAVREAIMWEVGFAPEACRTEQVRGMVLISMNDRPGSARLMVGSRQWRWSDLLYVRGAGPRVQR